MQIFSGNFLKRCINLDYGNVHDYADFRTLCSDNTNCVYLDKEKRNNYFCSKGIINPNNALMNFDNIFYCILIIFQMATGQSISTLYSYIYQTFYGYNLLAGIVRDVFIFGSIIILGLIVFFYIAILKTIFVNEENKKKGNVKPNLADLVLTKDGHKKHKVKEEDDIRIEEGLKCLPKNNKACKDIEMLKSLDKIRRFDVLNEIMQIKKKVEKYGYYCEKGENDDNDENKDNNKVNKGYKKFKFKKNKNNNWIGLTRKKTEELELRFFEYKNNPDNILEVLETVKSKTLGAFKESTQKALTETMKNNIYKLGMKEEEEAKIKMNNYNSDDSESEEQEDDKPKEEENQPLIEDELGEKDMKEIQNPTFRLIKSKKEAIHRLKKKKERSRSIKIKSYIFDVFHKKENFLNMPWDLDKHPIIEEKRNEIQLKLLNNRNKNYNYVYNLLNTNFEVNEKIKRYKKDWKILG